MPTVLVVKGYRFFFWSNENHEPAHVHVEKGNAEGKIWLLPDIGIAYLHGFTVKEQKRIVEIVSVHADHLIEKWNEHFTQL